MVGKLMAVVLCVKLSCKLSVSAPYCHVVLRKQKVRALRQLWPVCLSNLIGTAVMTHSVAAGRPFCCCLDDAAIFAISNGSLVHEIIVSTSPITRTSHKCSRQPLSITYRALAIAVACSATTEITGRACLPTGAGALHRLRDSVSSFAYVPSFLPPPPFRAQAGVGITKQIRFLILHCFSFEDFPLTVCFQPREGSVGLNSVPFNCKAQNVSSVTHLVNVSPTSIINICI